MNVTHGLLFKRNAIISSRFLYNSIQTHPCLYYVFGFVGAAVQKGRHMKPETEGKGKHMAWH